MLPPPSALALSPPEQPFTTQAPLPSTSDQSQGIEVAKGKKAITEGPQPEDKGKGKEVRPPTKAKDTEDALTIKDVVSKAKEVESKPKVDDPKSKIADPKEDPPRDKA